MPHDLPTRDLRSQADLTRYVESRGYRTERVFNSLQFNIDPTVDLRVTGLSLLGPRGNKGFVALELAGCGDFDTVKLWCDGVDYATTALRRQREERKRLAQRRVTG